MPDVSGPFDTGATLQAQWYRDRGHVDPSGVAGTPSATVAGGDLGLTVAGFGLTLALGRAHVRGAYYERTGTAWTETAPANTSTTGPRHDLLVLRRDLAAKTVTPLRVQGTPAANPTDPALAASEDGSWDLPLYRLRFPASSGTPVAVDDLRVYIDPVTGQQITPWRSITPFGGWTSGRVDGMRLGRLCTLRVEMYSGAGITAGYRIANLPKWALPSLPVADDEHIFAGAHNANAPAIVQVTPTGIDCLTAAAGNNGIYATVTYPALHAPSGL